MYNYGFRMASGAATVALFDPLNDTLLVAKRRSNASVHPGEFSLPGGFMEARWDADFENDRDAHAGETLAQTAIRETFEETGITLTEDQLNLFSVISDPMLDPRCHVINACYWAILTDEQVASAVPSDDIEEIEWWDISTIVNAAAADITAFNHGDIALDAIDAYDEQDSTDMFIEAIRELKEENPE